MQSNNLFVSPYKSLAVIVVYNGKRQTVKFEKHLFQTDDKELIEALKNHPSYQSYKFCLTTDKHCDDVLSREINHNKALKRIKAQLSIGRIEHIADLEEQNKSMQAELETLRAAIDKREDGEIIKISEPKTKDPNEMDTEIKAILDDTGDFTTDDRDMISVKYGVAKMIVTKRVKELR